ncbi:MAG: FliM/FliN family flagellar motor C-terminal domain-containing protein [Pseudomonadota bacterium]
MADALDPLDSSAERKIASSPFSQVHIELRVCVGRARPTVSELLALEQDSLLHLDATITEPVDIYAGDRLIARGELEELEGAETGRLAVRLTEVGVLDDAL